MTWQKRIIYETLNPSRSGIGALNFSFVFGNRWQHEMVGAANQIAPAADLEVGNALRNKLFTNVHRDTKGNKIPGDLIARNIQRARDHGIPGYDGLRQACGMKALSRYSAPPEIDDAIWARLMRTYKNDVSQIDGFTGGLAETSPPDGKVNSLEPLSSNILIRWVLSLPASSGCSS